jgi:DNA modification methylase
MIEMWDQLFSSMNPDIGKAFEAKNGKKAFELMHLELDKVWESLYRVLKPGGFACINIGDATRTIDSRLLCIRVIHESSTLFRD